MSGMAQTPSEAGVFEDGVFRMPTASGINTTLLPTPECKLRSRESIWMRDPFVLVMKDAARDVRKFYLFGTTDKPPPGSKNPFGPYPATGFDCYTSDGNLEEWYGPLPVFRRDPNFWADTQFWAPEVHAVAGKYYMLATFRNSVKGTKRGIQVLVADSPAGSYSPVSAIPISPPGWDCLDGTLCWTIGSNVGNIQLFLVFCREFVEVGDGQVCAMPISVDLTTALGEPFVLFRASEAPWVTPVSGRNGFKECYITDGPFMYYSRLTGELLMLWSSIGAKGNYTVGVARSLSGTMQGPWIHDSDPLFQQDGGHCMFFEGPHGKLTMALHSPNRKVFKSRPYFLTVLESVGTDGKSVLRIDPDELKLHAAAIGYKEVNTQPEFDNDGDTTEQLLEESE